MVVHEKYLWQCTGKVCSSAREVHRLPERQLQMHRLPEHRLQVHRYHIIDCGWISVSRASGVGASANTE